MTSARLSHAIGSNSALLRGDALFARLGGRRVTAREPVPQKRAHPCVSTGDSAPRPARDVGCAQAWRATRRSACSTCPRASQPSDVRPSISRSMARSTSWGNSSRGGIGLTRRCPRDFFCRSRAALRDAPGDLWYRSRARRDRSFSRHPLLQVFWCFLAEGSAWNFCPHSQQRRRSSFRPFASIRRRSPQKPGSARTQPRRPSPPTGSRPARKVDLSVPAAKASAGW